MLGAAKSGAVQMQKIALKAATEAASAAAEAAVQAVMRTLSRAERGPRTAGDPKKEQNHSSGSAQETTLVAAPSRAARDIQIEI